MNRSVNPTPHPSSTEQLDLPPTMTSTDVEVDVEIMKVVPKTFTIDSENNANWLVRRIIAAREYAARVKAWADQEQRRAQREEATLMYLFGRQLEAWVKAEIEKLDGRRKSLALPSGQVGYRTIKPRLVVDDESAVLKWAKEHLPEAVKVVESVSKTALNKSAEETGLIPDEGVHMEPEKEKFFVR